MRLIPGLLLLLTSFVTSADTMDHYMEISNQIPQMEMKADPQSQAWVRSARSILVITNESIAETLIQANEQAKAQGAPLFCLPQGTVLNAATLNDIILKTYRDISSQQSDKDRMTVSQIARLGTIKTWPCKQQASPQQGFSTQGIQHMSNALAGQ